MLRGTFATRCAEAKIAPAVLKEILGHSDISITMKYYVDIDTDFIKSENKNVVNYLIEKNIFAPNGEDIVSAKEAKIVQTETTEFDLVVA